MSDGSVSTNAAERVTATALLLLNVLVSTLVPPETNRRRCERLCDRRRIRRDSQIGCRRRCVAHCWFAKPRRNGVGDRPTVLLVTFAAVMVHEPGPRRIVAPDAYVTVRHPQPGLGAGTGAPKVAFASVTPAGNVSPGSHSKWLRWRCCWLA